ncbi:MAG: AraC family transcriptional regulator [Lachnospiraceae bacterium]|jgi:AraC-type DNA-binding domain-containing proteins|nr:AraC family transcriptional regulator [Lachnospiraceae bacterium]
MKVTLNTMHDGSEVVHYDTPGIPLSIQKKRLSAYTGMRADCHWHEDLEIIYLLEGEMYYHINGKRILLKSSEGIIVNSTVIHYGCDRAQQECIFLCVMFHPKILHSNTLLYDKYIGPVLDERLWASWKITPEKDSQLIHQIHTLWKISENKTDGYELKILSCLYTTWLLLLEHCRDCQDISGVSDASTLPHVQTMKKLVAYIHQHYTEDISLEDLCRHAGIGKSACCSLFKKHTAHPPIAFVNQYRLKAAADLLLTTDRSVTEIATVCGFNHHSYFTKSFRKLFACTPSGFRARYGRRSPQGL